VLPHRNSLCAETRDAGLYRYGPQMPRRCLCTAGRIAEKPRAKRATAIAWIRLPGAGSRDCGRRRGARALAFVVGAQSTDEYFCGGAPAPRRRPRASAWPRTGSSARPPGASASASKRAPGCPGPIHPVIAAVAVGAGVSAENADIPRRVNLIERQRDQRESAAVFSARPRQRPDLTCSSIPVLRAPAGISVGNPASGWAGWRGAANHVVLAA
jgi:hypothetical protein